MFPHQITLHFYHTNDKILIQSSSIITPGTTAAVWFVKYFIEPLATSHIANNQDVINKVNNDILSSSVLPGSQSCTFCSLKILPSSAKVKDQPLSCMKCNKIFHKRCTNRSGTRGSNWNRDPWLCPACTVTGPEVLPPPPPVSGTSRSSEVLLVEQSPNLSPGSSLLQKLPRQPPAQEDDGTAIAEGGHDNHGQPDPPIHHTQQALLHVPAVATGSSTALSQRFPNNSIRQRNSNVAALHPEQEFQKATIDACRSTIIQQEADIKTLKESLDIRNKKILQLESQVGSAKSYLSSREMPPVNNNPTNQQLCDVLEAMHLLLNKMNLIIDNGLTKTQAVNVYNNTCPQQKNPSSNQSTQTPSVSLPTVTSHTGIDGSKGVDETQDSIEVVLTCTVCHNTFQSSRQLDDHIERSHGNNRSAPGISKVVPNSSTTRSTTDSSHTCEFCTNTFTTKNALQAHVTTKHPTEYLCCNSCKLRFQTRTQLDTHIAAHHEPLSVSASSKASTIAPSVSGNIKCTRDFMTIAAVFQL